jgi:hypothetical protein
MEEGEEVEEVEETVYQPGGVQGTRQRWKGEAKGNGRLLRLRRIRRPKEETEEGEEVEEIVEAE